MKKQLDLAKKPQSKSQPASPVPAEIQKNEPEVEAAVTPPKEDLPVATPPATGFSIGIVLGIVVIILIIGFVAYFYLASQ